MSAAKPSLELLRELSDEHVLRALLTGGAMTRAELSTQTGISKPTVGESVRRLVEAGVVVDTGERTTGRGRVGSYYGLANDVGCALVVSVAPEGITAELVDGAGVVLAEATATVNRGGRPAALTASLRRVARRVTIDAPGPVRLAVVSAADPVERSTGRLVHLPDAPFLTGELSPAAVLGPMIDGPVVVDNDVNWAARAEHDAAGEPWDDAVLLYLGEGLGGAVVSDGEVRRGHTGIAGEIAHVLTVGPGGRAVRLLDVFDEWGLRHPGSTAVDVAAVNAALAAGHPDVTEGLVTAICGVLTTVVALIDPQTVVLSGPWGTHPRIVDAVTAWATDQVRPVRVRVSSLADRASLIGARAAAVNALQDTIVGYRNRRATPPTPAGGDRFDDAD